jgi:hypothetical protein
MDGKVTLGFAIAIGPVAWFLHLQTVYALAASACGSHGKAAVHAATAAAAVVALSGIVVGGRALAGLPAAPGGHAPRRARFMAVLGIALSLFFGVAIAAAWIPSFVLQPCD